MRTHFKNTFVAFLITTLLAPGFFFGITPPKQAEADLSGILGSVAGAGASYVVCQYGSQLQSAIGDMLGGAVGSLFGGDLAGLDTGGFGFTSSNSVPVNETNEAMLSDIETVRTMNESLIYKECVLDPISWVIKSVLINTILGEMMGWIDDGFEGGPVFLRDPAQFAKQVARETFDLFIDNPELSTYLCQPFATDVIELVKITSDRSSNLGTSPYNSNASCTLDEILGANGNDLYDKMVNEGDISQQGIVGAMALAKEGNNQFTAFFNTQAEAAEKVSEVVSREMTLASYADGFFSQRCDIPGQGDGVCTPGQTISKQVDDWLGGSLGQLEIADEISEILAQAVASIVTDLFADTTAGLLQGGLSGEQTASTDNFYDGDPYLSDPAGSTTPPVNSFYDPNDPNNNSTESETSTTTESWENAETP